MSYENNGIINKHRKKSEINENSKAWRDHGGVIIVEENIMAGEMASERQSAERNNQRKCNEK